MRSKAVTLALGSLSLLAFSISSQPAFARDVRCPEDSRAAPATSTDTAGLPDQRLISSLVGVSECWSADVTNSSQVYLNDLYTSLVVDRLQNTDAFFKDADENSYLSRDYHSEKRSFFKRMFVGKTISILISAKVHVRDPDVDFTVPLMSIDYNGKSGQGESFVTNVTRSDMSQPFMRLTPNSSLAVTIDARSSADSDINAGGAVIATLKDALALAAPGSSLVSSVNSAQLTKIAGTFDAGLSRLWSNSVSESSTSGRLISEWYPTAAIYVSVDIPDNVRTYDDRQPNDGFGAKYKRRTVWFKIQLSCPRISIFDTTNVCEFDNGTTRPLIDSKYNGKKGSPGYTSDIYAGYVSDLKGRIDPHQVLNYNLAAGKTIRQFVTEQTWYATLTKSFAVSTSDSGTSMKTVVAPSRIGEFCETVVEQLYNAGLSNLDAKIALWAFAAGLPDFVGFGQKFSANATCKAHMPDSWTATLSAEG